MINPVYPCLWFESEASDAADYYCSVFPNSEIISANPVVVLFRLNGNTFMALNGKTKQAFSESVSFVITCESQEEIDYYWSHFSLEGQELMCGWIRDKFGIPWQVIPSILGELMTDREKGPKASEALLRMKKIVIADLY